MNYNIFSFQEKKLPLLILQPTHNDLKLNRDKEKSIQKRRIKVQIEKRNKSPIEKENKSPNKKLEKVN